MQVSSNATYGCVHDRDKLIFSVVFTGPAGAACDMLGASAGVHMHQTTNPAIHLQQQLICLSCFQAAVLFLQELVVRINLPGTQHAKQAELHVESQQLTLTVAGKYHLQLPFPHRVVAAEGTASFNSGKQQLEVVLPAVPLAPSAATAPPPPQQQQQETQSQDRGANNAHELSDSIYEPESTATSPACAVPPPGEAAPKDDQLPGVDHSQQDTSQDGDAVPQQAGGRPTIKPLTANQQRWQELHPKALSSKGDVMQASASHVAAPADAGILRAAAAAGRPRWCAVASAAASNSFKILSELLD